MTSRLSSIHIYPMKSCSPLERGECEIEARGLIGDRRWMVVNDAGKAVTARDCPQLTLVQAGLEGSGAIRLDAPGMASLRVEEPQGRRTPIATAVWGTPVSPVLASRQAGVWLSTFLKFPVRLLHMDEVCVRALDVKFAQPGDIVSLADSFPVLLISQEAVDLLNTKLAVPVPMLQFRPNLVVTGGAPHVEDGWKYIRIGDAEFEVAKARTLCIAATVDFKRGERDPDGEPLRTLASYRRTAQGLTFGQKLIPRRLGVVRVGDSIEVIA
jgi:hypothetical protein